MASADKITKKKNKSDDDDCDEEMDANKPQSFYNSAYHSSDPVMKARKRVATCSIKRYYSLSSSLLSCKYPRATTTTTTAQTIFNAAQYSMAKFCRHVVELYGCEVLQHMMDDLNKNNKSSRNWTTKKSKRGHNQCHSSVNSLPNHDQHQQQLCNNSNNEAESNTNLQQQFLTRIHHCQLRASQAFQHSATYGRKIISEQYISSGLFFLTDCIFLPMAVATTTNEHDHLAKVSNLFF